MEDAQRRFLASIQGHYKVTSHAVEHDPVARHQASRLYVSFTLDDDRIRWADFDMGSCRGRMFFDVRAEGLRYDVPVGFTWLGHDRAGGGKMSGSGVVAFADDDTVRGEFGTMFGTTDFVGRKMPDVR